MKNRVFQWLGFLPLVMGLNLAAMTNYVSLNSTNPVPPYSTWATAATNIQDAVGVASAGDTVVVNSGIYAIGSTVVYGSESNRVALTNAVTLVSLNGPSATAIVGGTQTRCVYVGSNSFLDGFTVSNGQSSLTGDIIQEQSGGGIWCEPGGAVSNCIIAGNFAGNLNNTVTGRLGGGVYGGAISNCVLSENFAGSGGGAASNALWNCTLVRNTAILGGGAYGASLYNCLLTTNMAIYSGAAGTGGATYQCTAYNSTLFSNQASSYGGGSYLGSNFSCSITQNISENGGGTCGSTNYDCFLTGNIASMGGGANGGYLYNCVLNNNVATNLPGTSYVEGGGVYMGELVNCTVVSNFGGGVYAGNAYNSVVYFNPGANWVSTANLFYCCVTPFPPGGYGNITNDPSLVDVAAGDYRLECGSPCINAGFTNSMVFAATNDVRGVPRPLAGYGIDIGAYEYDPAIDQSPLIVSVYSFSTFAAGYSVPFVADIAGCPDYFWWNFGDGTAVTNETDASHDWAAPGAYNVTVSAYYSSLGEALSATTQVQVVQQPIYYVNVDSPQPVSPYTNWNTAAIMIQQAIAAASIPGSLILVTNGVYEYAPGGNLILGQDAVVIMTNAVIVQSVNGPTVTTIQPQYTQGERCAYVGSNSVLNGFSLIDSSANFGAGAYCEPGGVVSNCFIANNSATLIGGGGGYQGTFYNCTFSNNFGPSGGATYAATLYNCTLISNAVQSYASSNGYGGGACLGTLYNCSLTGNLANSYGGGAASNVLWNCALTGNKAGTGGGAYNSTFYDCLVAGNSANTGGGAYNGTFFNCTVAGNIAPNGGGVYGNLLATNSIVYDNKTSANGNVNNWQGPGTLLGAYTCMYPLLEANAGNFTNDPMFVNLSGGNYHLQSNSPCINSGNNFYVMTATDLGGNPRIAGGTVDMGAYEVPSPASIISYAWLEEYGLATDGSADFSDTDGNGMNNYQKWIAGLNPLNPSSVLQMLSATNSTSPAGITVKWQSVSGIQYSIQRSTNLTAQPAFLTVQTNITGQAGTTSYTDATATHGGPFYYRVGVP